MAFDVGAIEATLELDRDPFQAGLDQSQTDAQQFVSTPLVATLTLDDAEADAAIDEIRAKLEALTATPYTAVVTVTSDDGTAGFESLVAEAPAATAGLEDLGVAAEATDVELETLGNTSARTATDIGDAAAGIDALAASAWPAADALMEVSDGFGAITPETEAALSNIDSLAAAADTAGISYADFTTALDRAGIGFENIASSAEQTGVSTDEAATGLAAVAAQGSGLKSFFSEAAQGMTDWNLASSAAAADAGSFGQAFAKDSAVVDQLGGTLAQTAASFSNFVETENAAAAGTAAYVNGMLAAIEANDEVLLGMGRATAAAVDMDAAFEDVGVSAEEADAVLNSIVQSTFAIEEAGTGTGGGGGGIAGIVSEFQSWASEASTLWETLAALSPVLVGVVSTGVGAIGALAGAASIGLAGIGVGVLALIPDLSQMESAVKDAYDGWQAMTGAAGMFAPVVQGMGTVVSDVLNAITPLLQPAEQAFAEVEQYIEAIAQSPDLHAFVQWLGGAFSQTAETFAQTLGNFGNAFSGFIQTGWPFIQMIENGMVSLSNDLAKFANSNGFKDFVTWLQQNGPTVGQILANIFGIVESLWEGFMKLAPVMDPVIDAITKLADAFLHLGPVAPIIAGVVGAVGGLALLVTPVVGIGAAIGALSGIGAAAGAGVALGLGVAAVATVGLAAGAGVAAYEITEHWSGVQSAANDVGDWFSNSLPHFFMSGYDTVASSATSFGHQLESGWDQVQSGASDVGNWFSDSMPHFFMAGYNDLVDAGGAAGVVATGLQDGWNAVKTGASDAGNWFSSSVPHFFESGYNDLSSIADSVGHVFDQTPDIIGHAFSDAGSWLVGAGGSIASGLSGGITTGAEAVWGFFSNLPDNILHFVDDAAHWLLQIGEDVIEGFWNGLKTAWNDVFGWLETAAKDVIDVFKSVLGIFSPSTVMAELGENVMAGFGGGLQTGWENHVAGFLASSATGLAAAFGTMSGTSGAGTATTGTASLVASLASAPTALSSTGVGGNVTSTTNLTIIAPSGSAADIAAVVKPMLDQRDTELAFKVRTANRGHS